ncbi:BREX-2 system adenine-specific DNA-methyltransferase PglX [Streptomyces fradiae]|uniref:BREX-2 system adenine-specific DNA-methyltransferase PglX n=1 Tax=Streptomyces fradiae TaxID=1906 RepID=UPI0038091FEB
MDKAALLKDLRKQVTILEDDLRARTESVEEFRADLEREYEAARQARRTAATYGAWRDERVTQAAAAWILATVFVRFCEDNELIEAPYVAGPGERLADAEDRQAAFFREHPELNDRDWLIAGFEGLAATHKAVAGLFDRRHNALWELSPSYEAATALLGFWRTRGADGEIVHDFTDEDLDTRFLGDLYQDLSEHARKTYALLQTPEFVEEFILDLTLEPAVEEFGLAPAWKHKPSGYQGDAPVVYGLRCIDPACGSGHFLLGMFHRLLAKWREAEPGTDDWELVRRSLESVHGCDKNPFAVAIARFRLLVAVLKACGEQRLAAAPDFPINVAVGDSLLHGRGAETITETLDTLFGDDDRTFAYRTEDVWEYAERVDLLGRGSYHVVVGNPPYITVKDKQENENYRKAYDACAGTYALSVPFAQRIFELAVRASGEDRRGGFAGQITSNSFMRQNFGKLLIEKFLRTVELTHVIDTSGAYIPGHGTPTVVLVGRNRIGLMSDSVRVVQKVQGEPEQPTDPARGFVWSAIVDQIWNPGSDSRWISVTDVERSYISTHPWSLSGSVGEWVLELLGKGGRKLAAYIDAPIGRAIRAGLDDAFLRPLRRSLRVRVPRSSVRPVMVGECVRDWIAEPTTGILYPYDGKLSKDGLAEELWPYRRPLSARKTFQGNLEAAGISWWEYQQHTPSAYTGTFSIVFPYVSTDVNFAMDRGGSIFKQTAPVIKMRRDSEVTDCYGLLGVLNSSAASFWLKQVCFDRGNGGIGGGISDEQWEHWYAFNGRQIQQLPIPVRMPAGLGEALDSLAQKLTMRHALAALSDSPTRCGLDEARAAHTSIRARMIALQEELDWTVYGLYGLLGSEGVEGTTLLSLSDAPEVALGERAFEIVLARRVAAGEVQTAWFERHGSKPITEIPSHWPDDYKAVVQARIDIIDSHKDIALIERPEYKRRWASDPWEKKEKEALRNWLLDRCEDEKLWYGLRDGFRTPRTLTVSQLADALRQDADVQSVAELYAADHMGKRDATLAQVLADIIATEHVPYLAALRYKDSGLRKRAQWDEVWDLQREEDRTGQRLDIPVPPKYTSADFLKASYWSHRGKLDVPKERFVSYPGASPDSDSTILLGWAGWDHKDQVQALVNVINDRTEQAGWNTPRLIPLVAGIQELMPWVHQWHGDHDEEWGGNPAEEYQAYLDEQRGKHELSVDDLKSWRPEKTRGRAKKAD